MLENPETYPPKHQTLQPWGITLIPTPCNDLNLTVPKNVIGTVLTLAHLPFAVQIEPGGLIAELIGALGIERLGHIHQLQRLTIYRVGSGEQEPPPPHTTEHSRLLHSVCAAVLAVLVAREHQWDFEATAIQVIVELIHDAKTVAGGDALKVISEQTYDEDSLILQHFEEVRKSWQPLKKRLQLPDKAEELIAAAIAEDTGIHGKLHTFIDSLSYVQLDVSVLVATYARWGIPIPPYHNRIALLAKKTAELWRHLTIVGETIAVTHPYLLADFLELRALLWAELYNHAGHKAIESLLSRLILPDLFHHHPRFAELLFEQDDRWLFQTISATYGLPSVLCALNFNTDEPVCSIFSCWADARVAEQQAAQNGSTTFLYGTNGFPRIKPKTTSYFVIGKNGHPLVFAEAFPVEAAKIARIADANYHDNTTYLLAWPSGHLTFHPRLLRLCNETRQSWDTEPFHEARMAKKNQAT